MQKLKKVTKVMMFVWRNNNGKREFFILHRKKGDVVAITGHVGDIYANESLVDATYREVQEELGVKPINIIDLNYSNEIIISDRLSATEKVLSQEHAMLVEIPNRDVEYLENDQPHSWHCLENLKKIMTYPNQKGALAQIENIFGQK